MSKISREKLYEFMSTGGVGLSMLGIGSFLTGYVSASDMSPVLTASSVGIITIGGLSTMYGSFKQKYSFDKQYQEENEDQFDNLYDLELLELKRKELKLVETRFEFDRTSMEKREENLIKYNILKEKLLYKKVLEGLDTELQSNEEECDLIVSMIIETRFDEDYLRYREEVLTSNVVDFPQYESYEQFNKKEGKLLKFPTNSN